MSKGKPISIFMTLLLSLITGRSEALDCRVLQSQMRSAATTQQFVGPKRILWYRLSYAQEASLAPTAETAERVMSLVNAIVERASFGQAALTWGVTPLLQLPRTAAFYSTNISAMCEDTRSEGAKAGFDYREYDRDLLAPPAMPGWSQGMAIVGGRWLYIGYAHAGLVVHELGHTFGLPHANAWETIRPDPFELTAPPFPSNVNSLTNSFTFETNSFVGRVGVMFPGKSIEYGDPFDVMAGSSPTADFNTHFKQRLGWLPPTAAARISLSGVYRIYTQFAAFANGGPSALVIDKPALGRVADRVLRYYAAEIVPGAPAAIALRWIDADLRLPSQLIDATPAQRGIFNEHPLPVGRTFDDPGLGLSITAMNSGGDAVNGWVEVRIEFDAGARAATNPPMPHDELDTYQIIGQARDTAGNPLPNCLVHNGRINRKRGDRSDFASTETDAQGNYTLWVDDALLPHTIGASIYGYRAAANSTERRVTISASGVVTNIDFVFEPLPRVSVTAPAALVAGDASAFVISRTGATNEALEVWWETIGSADDLDYLGPVGSGRVTIPAGAQTVALPITGITVGRTITLYAVLPRSFHAGDATEYFPGWQLRGEGAERKWFQTDAPYAVFADAAATITIVDSIVSVSCRLAALDRDHLEISATKPARVRVETTEDLLNWREVVTLETDGSPMTVPIARANPATFYRAVVLPR